MPYALNFLYYRTGGQKFNYTGGTLSGTLIGGRSNEQNQKYSLL